VVGFPGVKLHGDRETANGMWQRIGPGGSPHKIYLLSRVNSARQRVGTAICSLPLASNAGLLYQPVEITTAKFSEETSSYSVSRGRCKTAPGELRAILHVNSRPRINAERALGRMSMDRLEFEAELRRDGYRVVNSSVKPNLVAPNHCHDFDAKAFVLGGEITITRDNNPVTFRAGQCFQVPSGCMHAEHVGPEGVALLSGRRRNGGPLTREAFESDLRREGFEVIHGGQKADFEEDLHAHDFDVRIMVLGGEIAVTRDGKPETFRAGDHCELAEGCQHTTKVGPEGVAYIVGKAYRRVAAA
jgi:quercetin dioxygenase-like cupin family protein